MVSDFNLAGIYISLLQQAENQAADCNLLAVATAAAMPYCHRGSFRGPTRRGIVPKIATSILHRFLISKDTMLSTSALATLVGSTAHYMVNHWPTKTGHNSHNSLPILLARVFVTFYYTSPDTAFAAAIALAVATFACNSYPGGEQASNDYNARKKRSLALLRQYKDHRPPGVALSLFTLGFFGLLPRLDFSNLAGLYDHSDEIIRSMPQFSSQGVIFSLPSGFSLKDHIIEHVLGCLSQVPEEAPYDDKATITLGCFLSMFQKVQSDDYDIRIYLISLVVLSRAESKVLRSLCVKSLDAHSLPECSPRRPALPPHCENLFELLCRTLLGISSPVLSVVGPYFGLLVAGVIADDTTQLNIRQSALQPLLRLRDRFPPFKDPSPVVLNDLVSHLEETITHVFTADSLEHIMHSVVDFCDAGVAPDPDSAAGSTSKSDSSRWHRLAKLKGGYRPSLEDLEPSDATRPGVPSPVQGAVVESLATSTTGMA
ncbi:hypothetical protein FRC06_001167 [Ceratobasidium sp. 370]|nr:hypothetical protein FRC06_001167 [Ceratobasidium sp. 370]